MDLYLFPEAANLNNGYGIGVEFAYNRLKPKADDLIIWYTDLEKKDMLHLKSNDIVIRKNKFFSVKSVKNILLGKDRTELSIHELEFLKGKKFENIHCDEVIFYRALRKVFPKSHINLRLHNCFARIHDRQNLIQVKLDWKYATKLKAMYKLEREIFQDKNCFKIFISDEDRAYYTNNFGKTSDSETWAYIPNEKKMLENRDLKRVLSHNLVWYGGIESHKMASVLWFVENVFPDVKKEFPDMKFHLWGKNTQKINMPDKDIYGHGFYNGDGLPIKDALYINPDIIGGGIKLKLQSLFESGATFISSPFGYEGYSKDLIDNKYIIVEENDRWPDTIIKLLR